MKHQIVPVLLFACVMTASRAAWPLPEYPVTIQDQLGLSYAPPCSLCHLRGNTGASTITTAFAWSLRARGMAGESTDKLVQALEALGGQDSDGDGASDLQELEAGKDPNSPGELTMPSGTEPGYGCGGKAPDPSAPAAVWLAPVGLVTGVMGRRRKKRSERL